MKPLVSVCIPVYNHEKFVRESILSVINQTYKNAELIILNDGSTDNSHEEILKLIPECRQRFARFEYREHKKNKGVSYRLNQALKWAKGEYFTVIASDDIMLPHKIELLVDAFENLNKSVNVAVVFGDACFIDENGEKKLMKYKDKATYSFLDLYAGSKSFDYKNKNEFGTYGSLIGGNYLPAISFLARTEKLKEVGGWTPDISIEDWDMWLKLSRRHKFIYVDKIVALYRIHDNNSIKTLRKKILYDIIKILLREKKYAESNCLEDEWCKFYLSVLETLRKRGYIINSEFDVLKQKCVAAKYSCNNGL